jgi:hypothetical protein
MTFKGATGRRTVSFSPRAQDIALNVKTTDRCRKPCRSRGSLAAVIAGPEELTVRTYRFLSLFAASLIAIAPVHAIAQTPNNSVSVRDRARPDYDPLGIRLGGFDLNASIGLGVTSTDNLFATPSATAQDDIVSYVSPEARLSSHWSRHALAFDAGADFSSHQDFGTEDATTGYLGAYGRVDIGRETTLSGNARYAHAVEPRTNPDALAVGKPVEFDQTELGVTARRQFNRFQLSATAARLEYDYDDVGVIDQDFRDSSENSLTGRLDAEITPRIGAVLQARADERSYDNSPGLSSEGRTYLAGVSINFTDLMRGELTAGQFERDYDSGASVKGTALAGNLEWYITRLTTINLSARRNVQDSGATVASPYVETAYGAHVDHELFRNVILSAGVQSGQREYQAFSRTDDFTSAEVGADYLLNRRVVLRGRFARDENDSTDPARDFEVNAVSLGVSLRL